MSPRRLVPTGLLAVAALLASSLVAAPAQAAGWTTLFRIHGAKSQACKVSIDGGRAWRVRVRLVNDSAHAHLSEYAVQVDGREVRRIGFRTAPRRTSATKTIDVVRNGRQVLVGGIGELTGEGLGSDVGMGQISRC
ncbi:hypothetical protein [Nocardioides sp. SYSU D00038]|uniref:hypothetical protein n=1 Tax=Nocardioides sp. SYSU D00038 TaxID=2812554 RepID=UPI0019689286|nr:hypothetical protein [Nocardioides sp. SYSU D00038]